MTLAVGGLGTVLCRAPASTPQPSTVGLDSHKAEGAVGNEEQLFAVGYQAAQDRKRLIPFQDVLLWKGRWVCQGQFCGPPLRQATVRATVHPYPCLAQSTGT